MAPSMREEWSFTFFRSCHNSTLALHACTSRFTLCTGKICVGVWVGDWLMQLLTEVLPTTVRPFRPCLPCSWCICRAGAGGGGVQIANNQLLELAQEALPFELTAGQQGALHAVLDQMTDWPPMQCLLQVRLLWVPLAVSWPASAA